MDGFSSAPPSKSVDFGSSHDLRTSCSSTPRSTIRELISNVVSTPAIVIDPPRPAKEGYEWVWFPAGYWAEREIVELPAKESIRLFRWRKHSGKSGSESSKHSSQIPHTANSPPDGRLETTTDYLVGRGSQTRTPTSSESGGYYFPLNRTPDAPLPSPYLTEEAHVQSLQWQSKDTVVRGRSISGSSVLKFQSADNAESDETVAYTPNSQAIADTSTDTTSTGLLSPKISAGQELKPKKSFISWRMLSESRQRLRRSQTSSDEYSGDKVTQIQPPRSQVAAKSPLRKESTLSDKSHKSRKSRSSRLFAKARWNRKVSSSSGASTTQSTASSVQSPVATPCSERGETSAMSNAWASEFPGGEAMRVQTPRIVQNPLDQFPRSFFSDLTPPSTPRRPVSRQEGQNNHKKTTLSTSFTPGGDSSPSSMTPHLRATRDGQDNDHESNNNSAKSAPVSVTCRGGRLTLKEKEWWEVSVPVSYNKVDQRAAFRFDLPEHLPTSPMCPANKRHKSGGTGVCVYHGRAKGAKKTSPHVSVKDSHKGTSWQGGVEEESESDDFNDAGSDVWK